ncbi:cytosolic carboxypeptidase-like protein 5 [Anthonomus grandis grandis]|uniref:cytosolic carboxypeptidase-like protein 5 n=1 Tax=Anthonomus grandis grandis TaxID=2921223 RepID=UPI00216663C9|nr:cytosolic carboxypeptidase-like protein 5 [Anthonomus grandis grandis]
MDGIYCAQFIFYNDFDSANLLKVEFVSYSESAVVKETSSSSTNKHIVAVDIPDAEFNIWTKPDCYGTEFENGNRTWFYFGVKAPKSGLLVKFNIIDLNKQGKMYSQGMAPVCRVIPGRYKWERIHDKPVYGTVDEVFTLSFKCRSPENTESITYFAFTYPFSYTELQKMLGTIDTKWLSIQPITEDDIYYVRETACVSLEGRNIDLITISSYHGITMQREDRLKNLFLDKDVSRPHKFSGKKVIFISARVHPGETPSSFVFNGILNFLLSRDDLQAQILRKTYVFKLIPFLNPDGVANGHYRTDTRGVNLNRVYLDPNFKEHPSIYAARALIRYYHFGVEKEDKVPKCEACLRDPEACHKLHANDSENINKMSHMSLNEEESGNQVGSVPWCTKWHNFCRQCGCKLNHTESKEEVKFETLTVGNHGDANSNESGLYLYLDLHGHASKKGIFMYGNHFDDLERRVECMLFPKLMGLNNHHFHFQGCNFTERNMYLRDKRDGMSRAGSGRVAVLSLTGIIKSYTLECNYNTGRLVNVLPPTVKESSGKVHTLPVPPKYTPQIFEEVGRSLGASILDLSGQNPFSRLPNSEFHNLNGLRDWLRNSCCTNNFGESRPKMSKMRPPVGAQNQGKNRTVAIQRVRPAVKKTVRQLKARGPVPIDRKENLVCHTSINHSSSSKSSIKLNRSFKSKSRKELSLKNKNTSAERLSKATNSRNKKMPISLNSQKLKLNLTPADQKAKVEEEELRLREICFIKSTEGKTMIAKYKNKEGEEFDDSLVVSWDAPTSKATVFTHKSKLPPPVFLPKSPSEPGPSKQGVFRIHNFSKSASLKTRLKKQGLRRLVSASELGKIDKKKKKKLRIK